MGENSVSRYDLRTHQVQTLGTPRPEPFNVVADTENAWISSLDSSRIITRFTAFGIGCLSGLGLSGLLRRGRRFIFLSLGRLWLALGSGYLWAVAGPKTTWGKDDRVWLIDP